MSSMREIESYITQGYVLDDHGNWAPIGKHAGKEREFLKHLMAGEVLCEGSWVQLARAREFTTGASTPLPVPPAPAAVSQVLGPAASGSAPDQLEIPATAPETVYAEVKADDAAEVDIGLPVEEPGTGTAMISEETASYTDAAGVNEEPVIEAEPVGITICESDPFEDEWQQNRTRKQRLALAVGVTLAALCGVAVALLTIRFL